MAKNKRIKACWLLLLTLLYTAGMVLAVAPSEARFNNTVVTRTMVDGQDAGVTSNCLVSNRDPAVTVLAGELNLYESTNVSFWLHSSGANATGTLRWDVVDSNGNKDPENNRKHRQFTKLQFRHNKYSFQGKNDFVQFSRCCNFMQ